MSEAWDDIQAIKSKRNSLRERLEKRKKERQDILGEKVVGSPKTESGQEDFLTSIKVDTGEFHKHNIKVHIIKISNQNLDADPEIEKCLIQVLADISLLLPINSKQLINKIEKIQLKSVPNESLLYFLKKAAGQGLIRLVKKKHK